MNREPCGHPCKPLLEGQDGLQTYPPEAFAFLDVVEERHFWFIERNRVIGQWIHRCVPDVRKVWVLEVGCGNGTVLAYLHNLGLWVAGVDLFRTALKRCRTRARVQLYQADADEA